MIRYLRRRHFIVSAATGALVGLCAPAALAQAKAPAQPARAPLLLVLGDSLSAEYGLARGTGWVALLEKNLAAEKIAAKVVNASISGATTAGGRSRLPALLKTHQPAIVVIELGSNDALRGLSLDMTAANLTAMTQAAQKAGAQVLLAGMQMPPNYGADYGKRFFALYPQVAKAQGAALVPFFLKGVADRDNALELFQKDRIHPLAEAHPIILGNVWPELHKLLKTK